MPKVIDTPTKQPITMLTNAIYGKIPNLDAYSQEELELVKNELNQLSKGFRQLHNYAEARQHKLMMQERSLVVSAFRFEQAMKAVWNKLPTWARW